MQRWARFLEQVNDDNALIRVIDKLELATPKREDLSVYREILRREFEEDTCFYCGKKLQKVIHVDHFIPWSFVKDDKIWNFVLSCPTCNEKKNNRVPGKDYLIRIEDRNAERRKYVAAMTFMQKPNHIDVNGTINQKFIEISNRQASFNNMSVDEKLSEIANLIENLLKKDNKFIALDYSKICFSYVTNEMVTKYRKQMHCFRHASSEAIEERKAFTEEQKSFLVDFGLTIVKVIYEIVKLDAGT